MQGTEGYYWMPVIFGGLRYHVIKNRHYSLMEMTPEITV